MNKKVSYSAIVLLTPERAKLLNFFGHKIPEGWEVIAHHCTINMGALPPELKESVGLPIKIQVFGFYVDDKVAATQVVVPSELQPFMKNKYPHITLAVNRAGGGKPVMSNQLLQKAVESDLASSSEIGSHTHTPISLVGVIEEVFQQ